MGTLKRIAPIFPFRNLSLSLEHYGRLGFVTREYDEGGYGFAIRDGIEIHLDAVPDVSRAGAGSAYLWVEDADELVQRWSSTGADVRLPEDTEWGQHEGVSVDPNGNIIRFGSPVRDESTVQSPHMPGCQAAVDPVR